jgi:hypothetical protein
LTESLQLRLAGAIERRAPDSLLGQVAGDLRLGLAQGDRLTVAEALSDLSLIYVFGGVAVLIVDFAMGAAANATGHASLIDPLFLWTVGPLVSLYFQAECIRLLGRVRKQILTPSIWTESAAAMAFVFGVVLWRVTG